jgi:hemolysin III
MNGKNVERAQTPAEELANAITHGIGLLLSVACLSVGVVFAALRRDPWIVASVGIYGVMLCLLYLASTLYHAAQKPAAKRVWNVLDHSAIYLLIAGTYTPYTLGPLRERGGWGWALFGVVWALAALGIVYQALFIHRWRLLSTLAYVGMGWIAVIAVYPLLATIGWRGVLWIAAGGVCYTLGVIFYLRKHIPYMHAVWHLFVLGGSILHFLGVLLTVVLR